MSDTAIPTLDIEACSVCGGPVTRNFRQRWECREHGDGITITFTRVVRCADVRRWLELQGASVPLAVGGPFAASDFFHAATTRR